MEWGPYVVRLLVATPSIYALIYMGFGIAAPKTFLDLFAVNKLPGPGGQHPWYLWPLMAFTVVGVGLVIYAAMYPAINAIPFSWGTHDEDGEWTSTRESLRGFVSLIGSIGVVNTLEKNAAILVWGPIEKKARKVLLDAIGAKAANWEVRVNNTRDMVRTALNTEEYEIKNSKTFHRDMIRDDIIYRLPAR